MRSTSTRGSSTATRSPKHSSLRTLRENRGHERKHEAPRNRITNDAVARRSSFGHAVSQQTSRRIRARNLSRQPHPTPHRPNFLPGKRRVSHFSSFRRLIFHHPHFAGVFPEPTVGFDELHQLF